jgi:hypothetical protein
MNKNKQNKARKSSLDTFLTFWGTLPGILTGIAAVIVAITGLYFAIPKNTNHNQPDPTPQVAAAHASSSPAPKGVWDKCFEAEFAGVTSIDAGNPSQDLTSNAGVIKIKLTHHHQPLGAVVLKYYSDGDYFEAEKVVDSKCEPIDVDDQKVKNNLWLRVPFDGHDYDLRLMYQGGFSAEFTRRP